MYSRLVIGRLVKGRLVNVSRDVFTSRPSDGRPRRITTNEHINESLTDLVKSLQIKGGYDNSETITRSP